MFRVSEKYVNIGDTSYEFVVDPHGSGEGLASSTVQNSHIGDHVRAHLSSSLAAQGRGISPDRTDEEIA